MLRYWQLNLQLHHASQQAIYLQIAQQIISEIQLGRLAPDTVMPGTRELANSLHVNRKTVVLSYDELIAQGWLVTQKRRGTFVANHPPASLATTAASRGKWPHALEADPHQTLHTGTPLVNDAMLDFTEGLPDARMMPYACIARSLRKTLIVQTRSHYHENSATQGHPELRDAIARMLNMEKGMHISAAHVCLVRNVQMGLFIAARTANANGNAVLERLCLPQARLAMQGGGLNLQHIGLDAQGLLLDELESLCEQTPPSLVFIMPLNQFPTTSVLSPQRRARLLELARRYRFRILEYDHDHEFHFTEQLQFPLASDQQAEDVMYLANLSQALGHGFSTAYIVTTPTLARRCADQVAIMDRRGNCEIEASIATLMQTGELVRHLRKMHKIYGERRMQLYRLVQEQLGNWADMRLPPRGLAMWLTLSPTIDMSALKKNATKQCVGVIPGAAFDAEAATIPALRLGFASLDERELDQAVMRLRTALQQSQG